MKLTFPKPQPHGAALCLSGNQKLKGAVVVTLLQVKACIAGTCWHEVVPMSGLTALIYDFMFYICNPDAQCLGT